MTKKPSKKLVDLVTQSLPNDIPSNIIDLWAKDSTSLQSYLRSLLYKYPSTVYYPVTVCYDKTIEQLISEAHFSHFSKDISSTNFPSNESGTKKLNIHLVGGGGGLSTEDVSKKRNSYPKSRFASLKELLSLCLTYPTVQNFHPIVALGSQWQDHYPRLHGYGDKKEKTIILDKPGFYEDREYYDEWSFGTYFAFVVEEKNL